MGGKILFGRATDQNIGYVAEYRQQSASISSRGAWLLDRHIIVMAGVPSITQAMLDEVAPKLKSGVRMLAETVRADAREGDIGMQLDEIAKANPEVAIGSYPFLALQHGPNTNVVLRARDAQKLAQGQTRGREDGGASAVSTIDLSHQTTNSNCLETPRVSARISKTYEITRLRLSP
jgi:hypothetical protein